MFFFFLNFAYIIHFDAVFFVSEEQSRMTP